MAAMTPGPIKNGIVRRTRSSAALKAALKGGIHQTVAARKAKYPLMVYTIVSAPVTFSSGGRVGTISALVDISVFAINPVEAENLYALIDGLFNSRTADVELDALVAGQHVIRCDRVGDVPDGGPDRDAEGRRIVRFGGQYRIDATFDVV